MTTSRRLISFAGFLAALAVLAFVTIAADPPEVWRALREVDSGPVLAGILANIPIALLFTLRSLLVLRRLGHSVPLAVLAPATVLGNIVGALTPAASGDILRITALQRNSSLTMTEAATLVVYERLVSVYMLMLSTAVALALTTLSVPLGALAIAAGLLLALLPWLAARFILPSIPPPSLVSGDSLVSRVLRQLLMMAGQVWLLLKDLRLLIAWSVLTVASFALVSLQFLLAARSAGMHLGLFDAWVAFGGGALAAIASLIPLGLGIGDGSIAAIIHATGIPLQSATAITIVIRGTITVPMLGLALMSYIFLSRRKAISDSTSPADAARPGDRPSPSKP